ncbi:hypothetical protein HED50_22865 [Ochrobactrum oryzae]|nr:hypothetical protein [Brucella oryzae]
MSETLSAAFLRGLRPERYAAQVNLFPKNTPTFLRDTGLFLNRNISDLLRIDPSIAHPGSSELTIIDIKATRRATAFHKTQVAFYVRVLEEIIREMKIPRLTVSDQGEIWRIAEHSTAESSDYETERFPLAPIFGLLTISAPISFPTLPRKSSNGIDETFFHLYFKCEQCSYLEHCRRSISLKRSGNARCIGCRRPDTRGKAYSQQASHFQSWPIGDSGRLKQDPGPELVAQQARATLGDTRQVPGRQ